MPVRTTRALAERGGVCSGLDEPYSATTGRPTLAATCISPESLLTTTSASERRSIALARSVLPQRLVAAPPLERTISSPMSRSFSEPNNQTARPCAASFFASEAKYRAGQRLDGPYSALGQRPRGRSARFFGELRVALGHQRHALFVELVHEVEEPVARLADESRAKRDLGEKRDQRRLEGVGEDDGLVVGLPAQGASQAPARPELELAVAE